MDFTDPANPWNPANPLSPWNQPSKQQQCSEGDPIVALFVVVAIGFGVFAWLLWDWWRSR